MHLTKNELIVKIPISRKGTKYVVRASNHVKDGSPVLVAIRDILGLAKNAKEAQKMINEKLIKINGRTVKKVKEPLKLFNVLQADKSYLLDFLPTGKFVLKETNQNERLCKVTGKNILRGGKVQFNLNDGTNLFSDEKLKIGDSLILGFDGKIKKIMMLEKGKNAFVMAGKNIGLYGKILSVAENKVKVKLEEVDREVELNKSHIIVR